MTEHTPGPPTGLLGLVDEMATIYGAERRVMPSNYGTAPARWVDTKEVAKNIRRDVKERWPKVKFSVRLSRYAGGSSIRIEWADGPTRKVGEEAIGHWEGCQFDGMIDLETNKGPFLSGGEYVRSACSYLHYDRSCSVAFLTRVLGETAAHFHAEIPDNVTVEDDGYFGAQIKGGDNSSPLGGWNGEHWWSWETTVRRAAEDRTTIQ